MNKDTKVALGVAAAAAVGAWLLWPKKASSSAASTNPTPAAPTGASFDVFKAILVDLGVNVTVPLGASVIVSVPQGQNFDAAPVVSDPAILAPAVPSAPNHNGFVAVAPGVATVSGSYTFTIQLPLGAGETTQQIAGTSTITVQ